MIQRIDEKLAETLLMFLKFGRFFGFTGLIFHFDLWWSITDSIDYALLGFIFILGKMLFEPVLFEQPLALKLSHHCIFIWLLELFLLLFFRFKISS